MIKKTKSNIHDDVLTVRSKQQVNKLIRWIGTDRRRYGELMNFFLNGEEQLAKKSAWIIGHCTESHPELAGPWIEPMIKKIQEPETQGALKRNVVRILQFVEIPKKLQGTVTNLCFDLISSPNEEIAVRTFSMTVISNIAKNEPDLMKELATVVRQMLPYSTPAFRARARMIIRTPEIEEESKVSYEEWLNGK